MAILFINPTHAIYVLIQLTSIVPAIVSVMALTADINMEQLTKAHLAPYSLTELSGYIGSSKEIVYMRCLSDFSICTGSDEKNNQIWHPIPLFIPLLRHPSDLINPITENGETFIPYERLKIVTSFVQWDNICDYIINDDYNLICDMPYWWVNQILLWRFDIIGLIDSNLAKDIKTI